MVAFEFHHKSKILNLEKVMTLNRQQEMSALFQQGPEAWNAKAKDFEQGTFFIYRELFEESVCNIKLYEFYCDIEFSEDFIKINLEYCKFHANIYFKEMESEYLKIEFIECKFSSGNCIEMKNSSIRGFYINSSNNNIGKLPSFYIDNCIMTYLNICDLHTIDIRKSTITEIVKIGKISYLSTYETDIGFLEINSSYHNVNLIDIKKSYIKKIKINKCKITRAEIFDINQQSITSKINIGCDFYINDNSFSEFPLISNINVESRFSFHKNKIENLFDYENESIHSFQFLKKVAAQEHNYQLERDMLTMELRYKLKKSTLFSIDRAILGPYKLFSDFGQSIKQPIFWWLGSGYIFACAYLALGNGGPDSCLSGNSAEMSPRWAAALTSLKQGMLSLGISGQKMDATYTCLFGEAGPAPIFLIMEMLQITFSGLLIFLFIKAVHNLVRLR